MADLDSNAWPQKGRNKALVEMRRCQATHLCGDQHLSVVVKHGIERLWRRTVRLHQFLPSSIRSTDVGGIRKKRKAGANPVAGSPLPWTGDYLDGLGNRIFDDGLCQPGRHQRRETARRWFRSCPLQQKGSHSPPSRRGRVLPVLMTATKRSFLVGQSQSTQADNDGRKPVGYLSEITVKGIDQPVFQVRKLVAGQPDEVVYTFRSRANVFCSSRLRARRLRRFGWPQLCQRKLYDIEYTDYRSQDEQTDCGVWSFD